MSDADITALVAMLRHIQCDPASFDTYSMASAAERAADAIERLRSSGGASENVCPTCHGKGATAPNGVQYCNCDDSAPEPSELHKVVRAHIEDLRGCVAAFDKYPEFANTSAQVRQAISELEAALGTSPEPGGDLATVKRLFAAECDDIDRLLERLGLGDKATIAERYRSEGGFLRGGKIENAIRERMSCLGWLIEWRGAPDKKARWATVTKDGSERVIFDDKAGDALRFARADDAYACMMMLWQAQWRGSENAPRLEELSVSEHLWCNGPSPETKDEKHV